MKKIVKLSAFLSAFLLSLVFFCLSAFAAEGDIAIKASNGEKGVEIVWEKGEDVYYYELYRKSNDGSEEVLLANVQQESYTDSDVVNGLVYGYRVVVVDSYEEYAEESAMATVYILGKTDIQNYYSTDAGLYLEWTLVPDAQGYVVYRKPYQGGKWEALAKCEANTSSYTDTTATDKDRYLYTVRAFAGKYLGAPGNQVALSRFSCPEIIGIVSTEAGIKFSWKEAQKAVHYMIYRKDSKNNSKWAPYALLDSKYTSYEDKDILEGVSYSYVVRAVDSSNQLSPYDREVTMKHISKPTVLTAMSTTNGIKLTWSKSEGAHGYGVYRKEFGTQDWTLAGLIKGADGLEFVDSKVLNGKAYTYVVRAIWNKNLSYYDPAGVTVRFLEAPQSLLCDADTARGNVLTWRDNPIVHKYLVFRKQENTGWKLLGITEDNSFADLKADATQVYSYTVKSYISSVYISGYATPVSTFSGLSGFNEEAKMVALTYDDGPDNNVTNGILDLLEAYGAKATFFVIGEGIEYNYEAMQRAAKMGCEIGTHTYSHIDLPTSSEEEIREEITLTDNLVKKYTGQPTKIARAPGGEIDDASGKIVNKPFFYWTIDTRDWESQDAASVIEIVQTEVRDGDIILMHDIYESTLEASTTLIPWLINEGYQLVTVTDLMRYKSNKGLQAGVTYYDGLGSTSYEELEAKRYGY